jgi:hypothetical protein
MLYRDCKSITCLSAVYEQSCAAHISVNLALDWSSFDTSLVVTGDGSGSHIQLARTGPPLDWRLNASWSFPNPAAGTRANNVSALRQLWPWQNNDAGNCGVRAAIILLLCYIEFS